MFNVSIVDTNATGTHFAGFIKNNRSNEVYKLGEIFTKTPPKKAGEFNCARLTVGSSPFQEIYSGGNFENTVSVQGKPRFGHNIGSQAPISNSAWGRGG